MDPWEPDEGKGQVRAYVDLPDRQIVKDLRTAEEAPLQAVLDGDLDWLMRVALSCEAWPRARNIHDPVPENAPTK